MGTLKKCLSVILLINSIHSFSQIVNIESERFTKDTTGWAGSLQAGFTMEKQDERYIAFDATAHLQYKHKKNLYLILGNVDLLKSKQQDLVNSAFFHFRYNYKIKDWLRWEAFTQVQTNKLIGVRLRFLAGTGPRFKVVQVEKFKTYIGTLYMMEYELNAEKTQKLFEGRFDGYLSFSFRPVKIMEIVSTTYYQPRIDKTSDFRISTDNSVNFKVYKKISLGISYLLNYDSRPPEGGYSKLTYNWENKIEVDF